MCSDEAQKICRANVCTRWLRAEYKIFMRPAKKKKNRDQEQLHDGRGVGEGTWVERHIGEEAKSEVEEHVKEEKKAEKQENEEKFEDESEENEGGVE